MNRRIPNGSWCLFKSNPTGSREGKVVLVECKDIQMGNETGKYTVKIYHSEKIRDGDSWEHSRIVLKPNSTLPGFKEITLEGDACKQLSVRGELVAILGQKSIGS